MVRFGKRWLNQVNETICEQGRKDDDEPPATGEISGSSGESENKGKLIMDATCAPADIHYSTDLSLLNEAREKPKFSSITFTNP